MNLIKAPILLGQQGDPVKDLQQALLYFIQLRMLPLSDENMVNGLLEEMQPAIFGGTTAKILRLFAGHFGVPVEEPLYVNGLLANAINERISNGQVSLNNTVSGYVKHVSGKKLAGSFQVSISAVNIDGNNQLGTATTDETGYFSFSYPMSPQGAQPALQASTIIGGKEFLSEVLYRPGGNATLNLVVDDVTVAVETEFQALLQALEVLGVDPATMNIGGDSRQLEFLEEKTGEKREAIISLVQAFRIGNRLAIDPEFIFGLLRQNMPAEEEALLYQPREVLARALAVSAFNQQVRNFSDDEANELYSLLLDNATSYITNLNRDDARKGATLSIITRVLGNEDQARQFLALYFRYTEETGYEDFWSYLEATGGMFIPYIPQLKSAITLSTLAGSNAAVVKRLINTTPDAQPEMLAGNSFEYWAAVIAEERSDPGFFYPDYVSGETEEEKQQDYAQRLQRNFVNAFPTRSVERRISNDQVLPLPALRSSLGNFMDDNPGFDFRTVSVLDLQKEDGGYNFDGVVDKPAFIEQVGTMQRLMKLTTSYDAISAMVAGGLNSSMSVVQMAPQQFVTAYAGAVGGQVAAGNIYSTAQANLTFNMAATLEVFSQVNGTTLYVLDKSLYDPQHTYAEWRTLFGSLDGCSCSQCTSVYSPSAYLTDILRFLKTNAPVIHDALLNKRRPDIKDIELSCKNTNTPVPHIDIVNELLEDLVSTGTYSMFARQTVADAAYQRAIPEYVNTTGMTFGSTTVNSPYPKLKDAKYPWTLPYNFYKRQIDTHLNLSGIKGHELVQRLGAEDALSALGNSTWCAAWLGISNEEKLIITTIPTLTTNAPELYVPYGFANAAGGGPRAVPDPAVRGTTISSTAATWLSKLYGRVDVFLQQTGLAYRELLELLDCYVLNPVTGSSGGVVTRAMGILKNASATSDDTCALDKLQITGMTASTLALLHRFVRLARALKFTFYELDRAMRSLGLINIDDTAFVRLTQVKRCAEQLNLSVEEVCSLWQGIETLPYRNYAGSQPADIPNQYQRIFYNPLLTNIKAADYPFNSDATFLSVSRSSLYSHLSGIFHIAQGELAQILDGIVPAGSSVTPSLTLLNNVYREALLVKALDLSVQDWQYYKRWIGDGSWFGNLSSAAPVYDTAADPFAGPFDTLRFAHLVRLFGGADMKPADVEYLLRDNIGDTIAEATFSDSLAARLTSLRTGLQKKWYPDYDVLTDSDGKNLQQILERILDADKASKLTGIIQRVTGSPAYTAEELAFIDTELRFFIPAGGNKKLADPSDPSYIPVLNDRAVYVYDCLKAYEEASVLKPLVLSFVAKEFRIEENVASLLLDKCVQATVGGVTLNGFEVLLQKAFVTSTATIARWDSSGNITAAFWDKFRVFLLVDKASRFIGKFGLGEADVRYLWDSSSVALTQIPLLSALPVRSHISTLPAPGTANPLTATFRMMANLIRWMQVRAFTGEDMVVLYETIRSMTPSNKVKTLSGIASVFKIGADDTSTLLDTNIPAGFSGTQGVLNVAYTTGYTSPLTYLRIIDCLELQFLLPASLYVLARAGRAVAVATTQSDASDVVQVVKAQYEDKQWLDAVKPVNDVLRMERRDAMLAYLLAYPVTGYESKWLTSNDIYETLMVDVEMTPCMASTRILLATNATQVWMDRILLGLEQDGGTQLSLTKDLARQWNTWRKLYRVWEANRKIFLYPENWIEPDLRDGKSPFFLELEKFLKQNEVTKENVEDAYYTYLERLDQVANLDIVGIYRQTPLVSSSDFQYPNDEVLHVFGRTKANPHLYFYRKRVANEWTAWEKMDVQIEGDHFIPVMWRGRLRFYWLEFIKDQQEEAASKTRHTQEEFVPPPSTRWKIHLCWTEYKGGKWQAKQMSKEALYSRFVTEEDPVSKAHVKWFLNNNPDRRWFLNGYLERAKKEGINFFADFDGEGRLRFKITEKIVTISCPYLHAWTFDNYGKFDLSGYSMETILSILKSDDTRMDGWMETPGYFVVKYNGVAAVMPEKGYPLVRSLYSDHGWISGQIDLPDNKYRLSNTDYWYFKEASQGYAHFPDGNIQLLNYAPGHRLTNDGALQSGDRTGKKLVIDDRDKSKYLVFPRVVPDKYVETHNIQVPYFFYKDAKNSFFVEKLLSDIPFTKTISTLPHNGSGKQVFALTGGISQAIPATVGTTTAFNGGPVLADPGFTGTVFTAATLKKTQYRFHNFIHDKVDEFIDKLGAKGLDGLLDRSYLSGLQDNIKFASSYNPVAVNVDPRYPDNKVDFSSEGSYSLYNWELFYHIPVLIANKLCQNQQFDEARRWYHYVFNPTSTDNTTVNGFWNFKPFYENATNIPSLMDIMKDPGLATAVNKWANDPFKPHLVARTRISAYMKNTVMKYLDNLIAWADNLFSADTRESINEATLLYMLAAQLLGRRPEQVPARAKSKVYTYATLGTSGTWNAFANALVQIESLMLPSGATAIGTGATAALSTVATGSMFYFCLPPNDKLLQYWDILADRLFKIRHCQSINGVERDLALFAPPIDPALLVKAAASGLSLSDALSDLNAPLPLYRFNVLSQKATELAQEVKSLGGQLLAALEKKDAESLSLLRNSQEQKVLDAATEVRERQIEDTAVQIDALKQQQTMTTQRRDHYQRLMSEGLNSGEQLQLDSMALSIPLAIAQGVTQTLSGVLSAIPDLTIGAFSFGAKWGGTHAGPLVGAAATAMGIARDVNSIVGSMAGTKGGYARRRQDWELQLKLANTELKQIEKNIVSAEIRKAIAELDLRNHKIQVENAREMDEAMHNKYTNEALYDWMIGQISFTYFQSYKLAFDTAKRAERCYRYELGADTSDFIQYGYWDSLKKGLLAGEQLMYDIKRMETSFLEQNKRHLELTKHVSLASLDPQALINLRTNRTCTISLPEWLFDMDYPGQHMRRIKSVSLSIPCVAGPYTTVSCKLSLQKSRYRKNGFLLAGEYKEQPDDPRFVNLYGNIQSIATSSAQNDSGMFEFSFRDERYLPFEGAGSISDWTLELPAVYAQFDYDSIADVILHVKYTALDGGSSKNEAANWVRDLVAASTAGQLHFPRLFSLANEFADEWYAYRNGYSSGNTGASVEMTLGKNLFPFFAQDKCINIRNWYVYLNPKGTIAAGTQVEMLNDEGEFLSAAPVSINGPVIKAFFGTAVPADGSKVRFRLKLGNNYLDPAALLHDMIVVVDYTLDSAWENYPLSAGQQISQSLVNKFAAWWKADAGITLQNGKVNDWADQSGRNQHFTTLSTSLQPSVNGSWKNGKPALVFNGGHCVYVPTLDLPAGTGDLTVFMVGEKLSTNLAVLFELSSDLNTHTGFGCFINESSRDKVVLHDAIGYNAHGPLMGVTLNQKGIYTLAYNSNDPDPETSMEFNGTLHTDATHTLDHNNLVFPDLPFFFGGRNNGGYFADFALAELIIFIGKATPQERQAVQTYLAGRYAL